MTVPATLSIAVSFDLICPWCLIGKRHLESAIGQLREWQPDLEVAVEWRSLPLIPGTPQLSSQSSQPPSELAASSRFLASRMTTPRA